MSILVDVRGQPRSLGFIIKNPGNEVAFGRPWMANMFRGNLVCERMAISKLNWANRGNDYIVCMTEECLQS